MKRRSIDSLLRRNIAALVPYSTARDEYQGELGVFLDANESPYENGYNRYPDPHQKALKELIARNRGVEVENIFVGNGSDEAIDVLMRLFCSPGKDNIVAISPSYGMYKVAAEINDVEVREVLLGEDFSLPVEALLEAADERTKLMFVCSPNNPTANAFAREELLLLAQEFEGVLVVDEAYVDFSSVESLKAEVGEYRNLVVLQTLSKAWGMAGLRLGLAIADSRIVELMSQVKYPYNINCVAQSIALQMLNEPIAEQVAEILAQREVVAQGLRQSRVVSRVYPSDANFLLVEVDDPDRLYDHFIEDGIIVRNRNRVVGCKGCLRITIGTPSENEKMLKSLERYEKKSIVCR